MSIRYNGELIDRASNKINIYYHGQLISSGRSTAVAIAKPKLKNKGRYFLAGLALWASISWFAKLNKQSVVPNFSNNLESELNEKDITKLNLEDKVLTQEPQTKIITENYNLLDDLVKKKVSEYKANPTIVNSLKGFFSELSRYDDEIIKASKLHNSTVNFLYAQSSQESEGDLRAASKADAKGLMQFMESTGKEMGLRIDNFIDERYSPKTIVKGAEYLRKHVKSDKDYVLLAAYNAGPTKINKIVKKYGDDWEIFSKHIPKETRLYIVRTKAREQLLNESFEFEKRKLFSQEISESDRYIVQKGDNIYTIAKNNKIPLKEVKRLNPTIRDYSKIYVGLELNIPKSS